MVADTIDNHHDGAVLERRNGEGGIRMRDEALTSWSQVLRPRT